MSMNWTFLPAMLVVAAGTAACTAQVSNERAASVASTTSAIAVPATGPQLSLGDSIAFGTNPTVPGDDPELFPSYPADLADLRGTDLGNAGCPGETSGSMLSSTAPDNGCRDYRAAHDLHADYGDAVTQMDFAVGSLKAAPTTALVTLNIGGNDLLLVQKACGADVTCLFPKLELAARDYAANLSKIFTKIRTDGGYKGAIVVLAQYATNFKDPLQVVAISKFNEILKGVATGYGAQYADGYKAFETASGASGDACAAGLLIKLPAGGCDLHPSATGRQLLVDTIAAITDPDPGM